MQGSLYLLESSEAQALLLRIRLTKELTSLKINSPPTQAASCVIKDAAGRLLLIKRANSPQQGRWSLPGGRVEAGETLEVTAAREVAEETGLDVQIIRKLGSVNLGIDEGYNYEVHHFLAQVVAGDLKAGDDAADVGWFTPQKIERLELSTDLLKYLAPYHVL